MSGNNVITVTFRAKRAPELERQQIKELANQVLHQHYDGRWAVMLTDFHYDQVGGFRGNIKQWLQEKLGAVEVTKPYR
ncbi:MAG: hypothetical protein ACK42D_00575 [Candidatus Paceibacteria bacterium]